MKSFTWLSATTLLTATLSVNTARAQIWGGSSTNASPTVRIINPHEGAEFLAGDNIHICAAALNFTDKVASVEFLAGTNVLGTVTNSPFAWGESANIFCFTWSNVTVGAYSLTAVAADLAGNSVTSSVVDIAVVTNLPPRVRITQPRDGSLILGPTNITICASAFDPDGTVTQVEFFNGTNSLGVVPTPPVVIITNSCGIFPIKPAYCLTWSNVPPGVYSLAAVATDNGGATATSAPVNIAVVTNLPPRVRIESPYNGASFLAPATVRICASASDPDGTVTSVQFFSGTNSLGVVTTPTVISNYCGVEYLYCLTVSNVTVGTYALKAVATDNGGASTASAIVNIAVVPPPPPTVKITSPRDGARIFNAPVNVYVCAVERYFTNPVVSVQFFAGTNSIGVSTNSPSSCILWKAGPGVYSLTAVATQSTSATVTSPPITITVVTNPPPTFWREWLR
jgi:hypothetical protein